MVFGLVMALGLVSVGNLACKSSDKPAREKGADRPAPSDPVARTPASTAVTDPPQSLRSLSVSHTGYSRALDGAVVNGEYTTKIQVGTPPQVFDVVVDTGSSNLFLLGDSKLCDNCSEESGNQFVPTDSSTARVSDKSVTLTYGSGKLDAVQVTDMVGISGFDTFEYTFGVITHDVDVPNILGLAYMSIAAPEGDPLNPYFDALVKQTGIANVFSMLLCGADNPKSRIDFGGANAKADRYMAITREEWYVVEPDYLGVMGSDTKLGSFAGYTTFIDSGTAELVVTQSMLDGMMSAIREVGDIDGSVELAKFPTFTVVVGSDIYEIAPSTYIKKVKHSSGKEAYEVLLSATKNQTMILGQVFMENYYTIFDRAKARIGFAPVGDRCQ